MLAWAAAVAFAGDCPSASTQADVDAALSAAEAAYSALDSAAFVAATDRLALARPCLDGLLAPSVAARWHRVTALQRYANGDEEGAKDALFAAHVLDPSYQFPLDLLPDGPLREAYTAAPTTGASRTVPEPRDGALAFDGTVGRLRPADRASFVQLLDATGKPLSTTFVLPADALPPYRAVPRTRNRLLIGAGVAATGAIATYAGSWVARSQFESWTPEGPTDPVEAEAHLRSLRGTANGLGYGAIVLGVVAGGGVVGAVVVGER